MRFPITGHETVQVLKSLTIFVVGLIIAVISGLLPLFAVLAGLPMLIVRQQVNLPAARLTALICLLLTWLLVDTLSFVFIGLGLAVAYSLLFWQSKRRGLGVAYFLGCLGGTIWLVTSNWSVRLMEQQSLLAVISDVVATAYALIVDNMTTQGIYSPEQIEFITAFQQEIGGLLAASWPMIAFIFICLATTACVLLLARFDRSVAAYLANWRNLRAPAWLAVVGLLAYLVQALAPNAAPWLAGNILQISNLVLFWAGFALVFFYLQHFRLGWGMGLLFVIYLFISPWLRPVLTLVGQFDAVFDYRKFIQPKMDPQS